MSKDVDPKARLRAFTAKYQTQKAAAAELGVSPAYLSDLLAGRRELSVWILARLGLRRTIVVAQKDVS